MKQLFVLLVALAMCVPAFAQSDCSPGWNCGSIPLLGVADSDNWRTDIFIKIDASAPFYFRLRTAPEHLPHYVEMIGAGSGTVGVYDVIERAWPGVEGFGGVIIFDFASEGPLPEVQILPMARTTDTECGKGVRLPRFLLEPGCHEIPRPWHHGYLMTDFQFFNYSETHYQTVTLNGGPLEVALPSPVYAETLLELQDDATAGAYMTICLGEPPPGSQAGFDPELPLWFIPRFRQFEDYVVSTVW